MGRYHGGFAVQPGLTERDFVAGLDSVARAAWLMLPHCSAHLRIEAIENGIRRAVTREHERILFVAAQSPQVYAQGQPRKLRATLRKAGRVAQERGLYVDTIPSGALRERMGELIGIERKGHRKKGHPLAARGAVDALVGLDLAGRLVVHVVRESGRLRGYLIAGHGARQEYFYTMAIHADLADVSAGTLLFQAAIQASLSEQRGVSLGPGDTQFKRRFATDGEPLADVLLLPLHVGGLARPSAAVLRRLTDSVWA